MVDLSVLSPVGREMVELLLVIQAVEVEVASIFDDAAMEILNQMKGIK